MNNAIRLPEFCGVLLIGPSGAGKSTFAHSRFPPGWVLSSDSFRKMITDDPSDLRATPIAFKLLFSVMYARLIFSRPAIVDATSLESEFRKRFLRLAARANAPAIAIIFNIDYDTCLQRNAQRSSHKVPTSAIGKQHAQLTEVLRVIGTEGFHAVHVISLYFKTHRLLRYGARLAAANSSNIDTNRPGRLYWCSLRTILTQNPNKRIGNFRSTNKNLIGNSAWRVKGNRSSIESANM